MSTLATLLDLANHLGVTADPTNAQLTGALQRASDAIRSYLDRTLDFVEDDELLLHGTGTYTLLLPDGPVLEVSLVEELDNNGNATEVDDTYLRLEGDKGMLHRTDQPWREGILNYRLTCSYGYTLPGTPNWTLPRGIRDEAVAIAARLYRKSVDGGRDVTQRSIGSYSETLESSDEGGGKWGLEPSEMANLGRYRWGGLA